MGTLRTKIAKAAVALAIGGASLGAVGVGTAGAEMRDPCQDLLNQRRATNLAAIRYGMLANNAVLDGDAIMVAYYLGLAHDALAYSKELNAEYWDSGSGCSMDAGGFN